MGDAGPSIAAPFTSAECGDAGENSPLFAALYSELHRLATRQLNRQGRGVSILIVESVRNRRAQKRGGQSELTAVANEAFAVAEPPRGAGRISAAVADLSEVGPQLAEVADLKYFCGFSLEEIAALKGLSEGSVRRHWVKARACLQAALREQEPSM